MTKNAYESMEKMYRTQRHFYDITRKYYLFGRDTLLRELSIDTDERILEAGCGTGRNLLKLARDFPNATFYGIDAASSMIETARRKLDRYGVTNVTLATELADTFSYAETFGLNGKFDKIVFSYSLSMMENWRSVIDNSLANLRAGGEIHIVDFSDQGDLPRAVANALKWWLARFGVEFKPEMIQYLSDLENSGRGKFDLRTLFRRYAFIARFQKAGLISPTFSKDRDANTAYHKARADHVS